MSELGFEPSFRDPVYTEPRSGAPSRKFHPSHPWGGETGHLVGLFGSPLSSDPSHFGNSSLDMASNNLEALKKCGTLLGCQGSSTAQERSGRWSAPGSVALCQGWGACRPGLPGVSIVFIAGTRPHQELPACAPHPAEVLPLQPPGFQTWLCPWERRRVGR